MLSKLRKLGALLLFCLRDFVLNSLAAGVLVPGRLRVALYRALGKLEHEGKIAVNPRCYLGLGPGVLRIAGGGSSITAAGLTWGPTSSLGRTAAWR